MWSFFYGGPAPSVETPVRHVEVELWDDSAIGVVVTQAYNERRGLWEAESPFGSVRDCFDTVDVGLGSQLGERAVVDLVSG